ncbi:hypothetical protein PR048_028059 [Dryococelus australis]|uniref:ETS domain-containing protein n=1 Tax=Dryococelus australis TaxID=614101 RepID=A0ABQ9GI84_9NEOP|nr:hypothetical protein PR048_028059 [Dryococelus australis]
MDDGSCLRRANKSSSLRLHQRSSSQIHRYSLPRHKCLGSGLNSVTKRFGRRIKSVGHYGLSNALKRKGTLGASTSAGRVGNTLILDPNGNESHAEKSGDLAGQGMSPDLDSTRCRKDACKVFTERRAARAVPVPLEVNCIQVNSRLRKSGNTHPINVRTFSNILAFLEYFLEPIHALYSPFAVTSHFSEALPKLHFQDIPPPRLNKAQASLGNYAEGTAHRIPERHSLSAGRIERVMLWRFLLNLLEDPRNKPCIHWVQRDDGIFRILNTDWLARLWGRRHGNPRMTYEKMARAMRFYSGIELAQRHLHLGRCRESGYRPSPDSRTSLEYCEHRFLFITCARLFMDDAFVFVSSLEIVLLANHTATHQPRVPSKHRLLCIVVPQKVLRLALIFPTCLFLPVPKHKILAYNVHRRRSNPKAVKLASKVIFCLLENKCMPACTVAYAVNEQFRSLIGYVKLWARASCVIGYRMLRVCGWSRRSKLLVKAVYDKVNTYDGWKLVPHLNPMEIVQLDRCLNKVYAVLLLLFTPKSRLELQYQPGLEAAGFVKKILTKKKLLNADRSLETVQVAQGRGILNVSSTARSLETVQVAQGRGIGEGLGRNRPWPLLGTHPSICLE